jgi:TPP-dependent 2-oxoacid decarboxylase
MLTIRIEETPRSHRVVEASSYRVVAIPGEGVDLIVTHPSGSDTIRIGLEQTAYVMNEAGYTVDTVRPRNIRHLQRQG